MDIIEQRRSEREEWHARHAVLIPTTVSFGGVRFESWAHLREAVYMPGFGWAIQELQTKKSRARRRGNL